MENQNKPLLIRPSRTPKRIPEMNFCPKSFRDTLYHAAMSAALGPVREGQGRGAPRQRAHPPLELRGFLEKIKRFIANYGPGDKGEEEEGWPEE